MAIHEFPYTEYANNLNNCLYNMCCRAGIKLAVVGDSLQLLDKCNFVLSSVKISQADIALKDIHGHNIDDYVYSVITRDNSLVIVDGNGNEYTLNIPYATEANHAVSADNATNAASATNATNAVHATSADTATNATNAVNATNASHATSADSATNATNAVNATNAGHATSADSATNATNAATATNAGHATSADTATKATQDASGNVITHKYVSRIELNSQTGEIAFYAADNSLISQIIPIAQVATEDDEGNIISNYIKSIIFDNQSNYLVVVHGDGTTETIVINYSNTAWKDTAGNIIKNSYFKSVNIVYDNDNEPWLVFYNGENSEIGRIQVVAQSANYATEAGHALTADSATNATNADHATTADSATNATNDADGDDIRRYYAHSLTTSGNNIQLKSKSGLLLNTITAPYATNAGTANEATHASTADTAYRAECDEDGANFTTDYIFDAIAVVDPNTWITTLEFLNKLSSVLVACPINKTYQALRATGDESGNNIKDNYAASLEVDSNANLILKSKNNVVLTTLASPLHIKVDEAVEALRATTDSDQNIIATTYIASIAYANGVLTAYDARGNVLQTINIP